MHKEFIDVLFVVVQCSFPNLLSLFQGKKLIGNFCQSSVIADHFHSHTLHLTICQNRRLRVQVLVPLPKSAVFARRLPILLISSSRSTLCAWIRDLTGSLSVPSLQEICGSCSGALGGRRSVGERTRKRGGGMKNLLDKQADL